MSGCHYNTLILPNVKQTLRCRGNPCYRDHVQESGRITASSVEPAQGEGVPRAVRGSTTRYAPPASDGIVAASGKAVESAERRRRNYPAKRGPLTLETTENVIETALVILTETADREEATRAIRTAAVELGVEANGKPIKAVIRAAREALARRANDYADLHWKASVMAALKGDAGPVQWAIERIAEGGQRIIDAPKSGPAAPTLQIGIALGGMPTAPNQPRITAAELPALEAAPAEDDVP